MSESAGPAIAFENVSKALGNRKVLDDVSFAVACGEARCILGRSGKGKSVSLKLMIGLMKPDHGAVRIQSEDITGMDEYSLSKVRRHIGFLFQSAALFDSFSVNDNLAVPLQRKTGKKCLPSCRAACANEQALPARLCWSPAFYSSMSQAVDLTV